MDIEKLARKMRERALSIEAREEKKHLSELKRNQDELDAMKKLYFHAGRWAGGARDRTAKAAFQRVSVE